MWVHSYLTFFFHTFFHVFSRKREKTCGKKKHYSHFSRFWRSDCTFFSRKRVVLECDPMRLGLEAIAQAIKTPRHFLTCDIEERDWQDRSWKSRYARMAMMYCDSGRSGTLLKSFTNHIRDHPGYLPRNNLKQDTPSHRFRCHHDSHAYRQACPAISAWRC